ncbi:DNA cytosine methyltransferase [Streptomyces sp. NPDC059385]|uniref:DNA cytosine methyltransferase n=1 Tax=Streptomyces sp. NPDC059385 TaxID=3346817 RepID=UPI0036C75F50
MPAFILEDAVVDGFAGPGGWSEGLRLLGLRDIGLEWDWHACKTRAAAGHLTIQCDIAKYPTAPFKGRVRKQIWSPPCQAWSRAGKGLGLIDQPLVHQAVHDLAHGRDTRTKLLTDCKDERSLLAAEPMRWLYDLRPEWVCMEEVPDVLPLWKQYAEYLRAWGYSAWAGILNAADYGVPQTRRRAILIASRERAVSAPEPTHAEQAEEATLFGAGRARWVSMAEALGWLAGQVVNTRGDRKTAGGNEFPADGPSWCLTEKARSWALRNGNQPRAAIRSSDEPAPTMAFGNNSARVEWVLRNGTQTNAAVRSLDQPAGTLFFGARCNDVSWVRERPATTVCATDRIAPPGHRDRSPGGESQFASPDTVRISEAEAAVLQSFRADYPWQGSKTKRFQQIGNAVPPLLAAHIVSAATGIPVPATALAAAA